MLFIMRLPFDMWCERVIYFNCQFDYWSNNPLVILTIVQIDQKSSWLVKYQ
jgi:hypothetical protein